MLVFSRSIILLLFFSGSPAPQFIREKGKSWCSSGGFCVFLNNERFHGWLLPFGRKTLLNCLLHITITWEPGSYLKLCGQQYPGYLAAPLFSCSPFCSRHQHHHHLEKFVNITNFYFIYYYRENGEKRREREHKFLERENRRKTWREREKGKLKFVGWKMSKKNKVK